MKRAKKINLSKLTRLIRNARSILVATHTNPDGDGIGSIIALGHGLRKLRKRVVVYTQDPIPKMYHFLPEQEKVVHHLSPDMIFDLSFIVDLGEVERVGDEFLQHKGRPVTVSLDHHIKGAHDADLNFCLPKLASSGEVVYRILRSLKIPMNHTIATNIYTAIVTDTGSFKYSNTTPETFATAAELVKHKIDVWEVALNCFETYTPERMALLKRVMGSMVVHAEKKLAWIVVRQEDYKETGASAEDVEGFINFPRSIEGVEVAVSFKETQDGEYKVGLRSKNHVDVASVALSFKGGGHKRASGCTLSGSLEEIKERVFAKILPLL